MNYSPIKDNEQEKLFVSHPSRFEPAQRGVLSESGNNAAAILPAQLNGNDCNEEIMEERASNNQPNLKNQKRF